jgi:hypothetical protein
MLGRGGTEVLLVPVGNRFALPFVEIPRWQRVAENLTAAVKSEWDEEVVCLFTRDGSSTGAPGEQVRYQVTEHWRTGGEPHTPTQWIPASGLSGDLFADHSDYGAIQQSVAECRSKTPDQEPGPFARLGWFRELSQWVETVAGSEGLHLNGRFHQSNASPTFSLIRFETNGAAVWFKAVGEPNQREYSITRTLAKLFPDYLPPILGERPDCNGWLTKEAQGSNLAETQDCALWETVASGLARLQIDSIGHCERIRAAGAHDLRIVCLCDMVQPFLEAMAELMDRQTKTPPAVLSRSELAYLGERVREAVVMRKDLGIPDTLGHLDLNPGNIIVSPSQCVFLDWAEAYLGNPFFSLEYLLEHLRRAFGTNSTIEARLIELYCARWKQVIPRHAITEALELAPLLAVFAYAAGSNAWADEQGLQDPGTAGYLRSLTRRMNREAHALADRRSLCLQ